MKKQMKKVIEKKDLELLKKNLLFQNIEEQNLEAILICLAAREKKYQKNEFVFSVGEEAVEVGVILSGSVLVVKEDYWGNRGILAKIGEGDLFGEAFSCAGKQTFPISIIAVEPTRILLVNYQKIVKTCSNACAFHTQLIQNMMMILAEKNRMMTQKMEHLTKRTTREKLLSYLSAWAIQSGGDSFQIPFSRQELADYLSVDRSAMSNELSKLRKEGILSFQKNKFIMYHLEKQ